ncbi:MAG: PQQ-dependent sugar dehydrogenase [Rhodobacteraceae bacterium]|nr:PQQ-dependent sugar dehydrogenase [Paracoccaceae bacterium]
MFKFYTLRSVFITLIAGLSWTIIGTGIQANENSLDIQRITGSLDFPWSVTFLDNCEYLVTEKRGRLYHYNSTGKRTLVKHTLKVSPGGQGGLLDVVAARDFTESRQIFLTYATSDSQGLRALGVSSAELVIDNSQLSNEKTLLVARPGEQSTFHFGSRIVEANDGTLFITHGDRGNRESAQDPGNYNGKLLRINRDGTVPNDNPFVSQAGVLPEIWTFGHRNPQGAGLDLNGNLLTSEHGARGGDEVNLIEKGRNYGWPIISYGTFYTGDKIGIGTALEGMEQPKHYWDPSIAPSGLMVYSGKLWPEWQGHVFVGSLKFDYIAILDPKSDWREVATIQLPETKRVRDVREAPDGTIWFLAEDRNGLYQVKPQGFTPQCSY